jgi:hypothetical protein
VAREPSARAASLGVFVLGGGIASADASRLAGAVAARLELALNDGWGLGLSAGLESARSADFAPGSVGASVATFGLFGSRALVTEPLTLLLVAGPKLDVISAWATGYSTNQQATVFSPGLAAALEWRIVLGSGLSLLASVGLSSRFQTERLEVRNVGTALSLYPLQVGAMVGGGWNFL